MLLNNLITDEQEGLHIKSLIDRSILELEQVIDEIQELVKDDPGNNHIRD